ncbi:uncharacterized protein LOC119079127 [Bradysia coprophila]|uniref:uncharacterized protein LOC119079127 n=1 Tax=Bradysia coprophila TaxID=38358 RepID=UPI00187DA1AE|nr:uncharacterized protein LOC119079127 [Bradysia coprophila]
MQAEQEVPLDITSEVCQNSDSLGCVNYDSGWSSSNVSCSGTTKLNSLCDPTLKRKKCCNSALGDQIPPVLTLHARLDRKRKNSVNESNASASGAPAPKKQNCEPDVDFALANRQLEEVLSNERTTTPLHSINQTENASQVIVTDLL